jgi:hypothetical protein
MAGMEGLGRVYNVITVASGQGFIMNETSAVSIIATSSGAASIAVTAAKTFAGSYDNFTPANGFGQATRWYQSTATNGTAGWTKMPAVWTTNSLALAGTTGYMSVVDIFGSQIADGYKYLKVTGTNCTIVVVTHDLTVQRTPANLQILGA